jgi:transcriptional regulator GlxA family with amidase domain
MAVAEKLHDDQAEHPDLRLVLQLLGQALTLLDGDLGAARRRVEDALALLSTSPETERPKNRILSDRQVRKAEEFIRDHLGTCLRIEDVARSANLSSSYFSRAFKKTIGISYSEFVMKERLDLAKRLLLTSNASIAEVALLCGLADQSHLTRLFNRTEGLPPRAWRRMLRELAQHADAPSSA